MVSFKTIRHFLILSILLGGMTSCSPTKHSVHATKASEAEINPLRHEIVQHARETVGSRYQYGGTGTKRFDCSGLVYSLYTAKEIKLPRSTKEMARYGEEIKLEDAQPGDLIFFRNVRKIDHVAIVSRKSPAKTWLIHSTTSRGVIEEVLEDSHYWNTRIDQCRRLIP